MFRERENKLEHEHIIEKIESRAKQIKNVDDEKEVDFKERSNKCQTRICQKRR